MDSSRIFVKGLPPNLNEADLRKHFASKGHITDIKLIPHRRIGYVGYKDSQEAAAAVKYFNRSFVRMSRITVELAKPIADPSLSKIKDSKHGPKASTEIPQTTKRSNEPDITIDNAKKRKRDALDESDPKLQEFLNVMQPAKTSTSTVHGIGAEPTEEPPAKYVALAVVEGELDDEYEVVPSWRKKSQPADSTQPTKPSKSVVNVADAQPHEEVERDEDPTIEQTLPDAPSSAEATTHVPVATDDDWLRSRTNRLLDLVDVEDIIPTPASEGVTPPLPPSQEQEQPEVIDATVDEDQDMDDQGQHLNLDEAVDEPEDGDLDTVRKTKRLFARNLPYSATEDDLRSYFERYGTVDEDAVNASVADRLGISKAELLDPTNSDAAVKQAIAETSTIQDTKAYLVANGVDLDAFKSGPRGDTTILVKNFPYGTSIEEIRTLFEEHGQVLKVLMPPTGTIAIVQFAQGPQAKAAFTKLAYRRFKESILFLEKAPKNLFVGKEQQDDAVQANKKPSGVQKLSVSELLEQDSQEPVESTSLFVKNLHWDTTTQELADEFKHLEGFRSAQVKTKKDPKKPGQVLSMGFGFVSFANKAAAEAALKVMDGHSLRAHKLQVRASHRGRDAAEERRQEDNAKKAANQRTKIVIKNVPFQTNKNDIRTLLSTYGQLKSVRIPKKFNATSKGFAFAEFVSAKEAESAMLALQDTHLLGRRLILQYAEAESIDPEEEIAKMQKKVGGQASRIALQQLTGGGRKKVNLGGDEDEGEI
ncbi:hypothetical protein ABKA04_008345 [Annulohypoxylon sp. FPYF3050]